MATTIRDVVVRLNIEQAQAALKAPDITKAQAAVDAFQQTMVEAANKVQSSWQATGEAIGETAAKTDGFAKRQEQTAQGIVDANMKTLDSFKAAGEGAFTLARGIAFLSASSDKDFQKTLQSIARVQGAFDAFKGGIETIKGVTEAVKTLTAYTQSLAVAQTAQAGAAKAATASQGLLAVAMGPVGIAVAAATAAVALFALALRDSGEAAIDAATKWSNAADTVEQLRNTRQQAIKTIGDETMSMRTAEEQQKRTTARYKEIGLAITAMRNSIRESQYGVGVAGAFGDAGTQAQYAARELAMRKDLDALLDEKQRKQLAIGELEQRELDRKEALLRKDYQALQVVKDKLRAEEQRSMSADAAFAKMSQFDRITLENLSKAAQTRELSKRELMQLERVGGSAVSEFVTENLSDIGKSLGSRDVFSRFKLTKSDKATQEQLQKENARLSGLVGVPDQMNEIKLAQAVENKSLEMAKERQRIATRTADLLDQIRKIDLDNETRIIKLEQEFKNRRKSVQ